MWSLEQKKFLVNNHRYVATQLKIFNLTTKMEQSSNVTIHNFYSFK